MNLKLIIKVWPTILHNRLLRILFSLNIIFIAASLIFFFLSSSYHDEIIKNSDQVLKNEQAVVNLQKIVLNQSSDTQIDINQTKVFADFEEVIPFVSLLENLLLPIDEAAEITIASSEDQIFRDRYADYRIVTKVADQKLFLSALEQLQESRFILKLTRFNLLYEPGKQGDDSFLDQVEIGLRLYLK